MAGIDEKYMLKALRLGEKGIGAVEPNPAVGCVIIKGGQIIGKGWHRKFGGPHAEINALADCKVNGFRARGGTMYVTLEPCCHQGKTGPCTDAVIKAKVAKVVVAMVDPFKRVSGKGIRQLRKAGIEVVTGVCGEHAMRLNGPFVKFAESGKSWVVLKWAQSSDGKMAWKKSTGQRWISNEKSRKDVHKLRRRVQGILVGIDTVIADDPMLTARPSRGRELTRIVLDSQLRIPLDCTLLKTAKEVAVLIVTGKNTFRSKGDKVKAVEEKGGEVCVVSLKKGRCDLGAMVDELGRRGVQQLLVEGGPTVITSFLEKKLADEICIYVSQQKMGAKGSVDISKHMAELVESMKFRSVEVKHFDEDVKLTGFCR